MKFPVFFSAIKGRVRDFIYIDRLKDELVLAKRQGVVLERQSVVLERKVEVLRESRDLFRDEFYETRRQLEVKSNRSLMFENVAKGIDLESSVITLVRDGLDGGDRILIRSFSHSLINSEAMQDVGNITTALVCFNDGLYETALDYFNSCSLDKTLKYAALEYFSCAVVLDGFSLGLLEDHIEGMLKLPDAVEAIEFIKLFVRVGDISKFVMYFEKYKNSVEVDGLSSSLKEELSWYDSVLSKKVAVPKEALADEVVNFAVIDYKMLDRAKSSSNHGDYIQTLASLANICRFSNVNFDADSYIGPYLSELQGNISGGRKIKGDAVKVYPHVFDRDFSSGRNYPENTWLICFGWFMHANFRVHYDFPFPSEINPIFISFHVNRVEFLTDDAVKYLQAHSPIGCRDWTSVYLLRERGVDAFFSGCLTTTVSQLFEEKPSSGAGNKVAIVESVRPDDLPSGSEITEFTQAEDSICDTSMVESLRYVKRLLDSYREFDLIVTHRLHCYLPCRSLGLNVDFRPKNKSDVRFEGLLDLTDQDLTVIRSGIEDKLESVLGKIFSGQEKSAVYDHWRDICSADLLAADSYCNNIPPLPKLSFNLGEAVGRLKNSAYSFNFAPAGAGVVHIAFATDENLADELAVVIHSIVKNTEAPLSVSVLTRGLGEDYFTRIANDFKNVHFTFFKCDDVSYGNSLRMLSHITVSTMDRLLLPELLSDLDKVLYLDIDILVVSDIAELYGLSLGDKCLAGKNSTWGPWRYGTKMAYRASLSLGPEDAWHLRRKLHSEGKLHFNTFNAGVILMNLNKMREDSFSAEYIPYIEHFAMNDQDVLNMYARENRLELDGLWNSVPSQDICEDAKLLHWAGPIKPWSEFYIRQRELFQDCRASYLDDVV